MGYYAIGPFTERALRIFLEDYSDMAPFGVMLYGSAEVFLVSENILALPSTCLFQSLLSRKTRTTKTSK